MIKAVLFDLDGTLLPGDLGEQIRAYFTALAAYAEKKYPALAATVSKDILAVVAQLRERNDGKYTMRELFWMLYGRRAGVDTAAIEPYFDDFYRNGYGDIGKDYLPEPRMAQAVALCRARGFKVCVATNPFYPRAAVEWRLRWAGINAADFELITDYTRTHYFKPRLGYYEEVAALLGVSAAECAMVGNHTEEDMVAAGTGMQTFLLTDYMLGDSGCYGGLRGSYDDLLVWLRAL